ncbi:MAG: hypothetical protein GY861_04715 [bacterium]|nr:hypothetical protein [bacterium]
MKWKGKASGKLPMPRGSICPVAVLLLKVDKEKHKALTALKPSEIFSQVNSEIIITDRMTESHDRSTSDRKCTVLKNNCIT